MLDISPHVTTLDICILGLYMLIVLGLAFYFSRFSLQGADNFFLGGRKLPGWANGISYAATSMNADVPAAYCGMMAVTGIYLAWFYLSRFGLALMIGGILFAVFWRKLRFFTAPEFYVLRFGRGVGNILRTWIAIRSAFIAMVAWTGAGLLGLHKITGEVLGWDLYTTLLITVPIVCIYVYFSGLAGVIVTDIFQTVIMILANIVLLIAVLQYFGGPVALGELLHDQFGPATTSIIPPINDERLGVIALLAWLAGTSLGYGGDISPMSGAVEGQRLLSTKSHLHAAYMYFTTAVTLFLLLLLLTLPALGGILIWPEMRNSQAEAELIYGKLLAFFLQPGLLGLALAGLTASVMSTVSSNLNFGGQIVANDVYKHLIHPDADERKLLWIGRISMLVITFLSILVAIYADSLISIAVFMLGLSSAELMANWAQWWWWRFNKWGRMSATFGGPLFFLLSQLFWINNMPEASSFQIGYLATLTGITVNTIVWVMVTLLTPPDPPDILESFYQKAKPMGFWKPIYTQLGMTRLYPKYSILKGIVLSILGFIVLCCLFLGLSEYFVGHFVSGNILVFISIILSIPAFLYIKKYLKLMR